MATPIPALVETSDPPLSTDSDAQFDAKAFPWAASLDPFGQSVSAIAVAARDNAEDALAAALGGDLPPLTGKAGEFLRVKADESGAEFAEVPEPVTQSTADWEAGTSTTEGIVSPAKVAASAAVNSPVKAWVNFDGTGTVSIRESFNVSSITDNGTGDYTINFATTMPDANYVVSGIGQRPDFQDLLVALKLGSAPTQTISDVSLVCQDKNADRKDVTSLQVSVIR